MRGEAKVRVRKQFSGKEAFSDQSSAIRSQFLIRLLSLITHHPLLSLGLSLFFDCRLPTADWFSTVLLP